MKKLLLLLSLMIPGLALAGTGTSTYSNGSITWAQHAVVPDSFTTGGSQSGSSPYTFTLGPAASANFVAVGCSFTGGDSATSVTFGGVSMALSTTTAKGIYRTAVYTLQAPATGTQTVAVNSTIGVKDNSLCTAASFKGANASNAVDVSSGAIYVSGNGGVINVVMTTTAQNEILFDAMVDGNGDSPSVGPNQTLRIFTGNGSGEALFSTQATTTSGTYTQTYTGIQDVTMMSVIAIKP